MNINEASLFSAISHPVRRQTLTLLMENGPLCVCHIAEQLGVSQPVLSRQMAVLNGKGLLRSTRQGHWIFYRLSPDLPGWARDILRSVARASPERVNLPKRTTGKTAGICPTIKSTPLHLLFLCTQNACRSQMAHGWAKTLGMGFVEVRSAGTSPHPDGVHPLAVCVMDLVGIDISGQTSTGVDRELLNWADRIVTVCGEADEACPVLSPGIKKEHWPIADPDRARGSSREIFEAFCRTRDEIGIRVRDLLGRIETDGSFPDLPGLPAS